MAMILPAGSIACPCGQRVLSAGVKRCGHCGAPRPRAGIVENGPVRTGGEGQQPPVAPSSPSKEKTDFEKQSDKLRRAAPDGLVSYKNRMKPTKGTDDETAT